jgi:hypothetical protein
MQKVSYMGNGSTTDFYFNFPFYTNTDIIVLKNNQITTDYTVVGTPAGLNADIPYTGGKVVFNNAPSATDSIIIYRHLPLTRTVDYQPTEKINPTLLNQDMNYMMEVLKDMQDKMDTFSEQYNDIVNKESTDNLLSKIHYINQLIDNDEIINKYTSNSITKIPQDLKTELSSGTFTLKSGSKIYVPNGSNIFDAVITTSNLSVKPSELATSSNRMVIYTPNGTIDVLDTQSTYVYSGTSAPTIFDDEGRALWYDTANNSIKKTSDNGSTWTGGYGFPIALIEITNGIGVTAINQVFNGFGFIGAVTYALPGIKYLVPDGRNADGTLKSVLREITSVVSLGDAYTTNLLLNYNQTLAVPYFTNYAVDTKFPTYYSNCEWYNPETNEMWHIDNGVAIARTYAVVCGNTTASGGKITSLTINNPLRIVDYNDTGFIGHQAMPSNRYTDLTLGSSGTTYTAPADGYFIVNKAATASGEYINMINNLNDANVNSIATGAMNCRLMIPVSKNDVVTVNYTVSGTTNWFRFIYTNGAK